MTTAKASEPSLVACPSSANSIIIPDCSDRAMIEMGVDIKIKGYVRILNIGSVKRGKNAKQKFFGNVRTRLVSICCKRVVRGEPLGVPDRSWSSELIHPIGEVSQRHYGPRISPHDLFDVSQSAIRSAAAATASLPCPRTAHSHTTKRLQPARFNSSATSASRCRLRAIFADQNSRRVAGVRKKRQS